MLVDMLEFDAVAVAVADVVGVVADAGAVGVEAAVGVASEAQEAEVGWAKAAVVG